MRHMKTPKRYWLNVSLPHRAAKKRYERAAKQAGIPLAVFARRQLDRGAEEILGPDPTADLRRVA